MDELSALCHEYQVEVGGIEEFSLVFLAVVQKAITLLNNRDSEGTLLEIDLTSQRELEESLRYSAVIDNGSKAMLKLTVEIVRVVIFYANRGPTEVL